MSEAGTAKRVPSLLLYEVSRTSPSLPWPSSPIETPAAIPAGVSPCPIPLLNEEFARAIMRAMSASFVVREEMPADRAAVRAVNVSAFRGDAEADLVERLCDDEDALFGLVAEVEGQIVGHILFSRLPIETDQGVVPAAALAPLAVLPAWQRRGVGSALVREGLARCRERWVPAVVVLGDPEYYGRFGFRAETARGLQTSWSGPHLMAIELVSGGLASGEGATRYPVAFEDL